MFSMINVRLFSLHACMHPFVFTPILQMGSGTSSHAYREAIQNNYPLFQGLRLK